MAGMNRLFVAVFALAWIGLLALVGWLVWDQARFLEFNDLGINFNFDVNADARSEQILATIVLGALALPPLGMLAMQMRRSRGRRDKVDARAVELERTHDNERYTKLELQVADLERRLESERETNRRLETDIERARPEVASATDTRHSRRWHLPTGSASRR